MSNLIVLETSKAHKYTMLLETLRAGAGVFHYCPGWRDSGEFWAVSAQTDIMQRVTRCEGDLVCDCGSAGLCKHVVVVEWSRLADKIKSWALENDATLRRAAETPLNDWWNLSEHELARKIAAERQVA